MAMGRYLAILAVLAVILACLTGDVSAVTDEEFQTMQNQLNTLQNQVRDCLTVVISQAAKIIKLEEQLEAVLGPSGAELVQNKTIEERVALLELQMTEVQVDADLIEKDVDVYKGQTLGLEGKVYTLEGTVVNHEARITSTEGDAEVLQRVSRSVSELEERVETLGETAVDHEARITSTEGDVKDTIAFHAVLSFERTLPNKAVVKFNEIILNEGNGYDSTTGVFTVPPGGDGMYFFSTYLLVDLGEAGLFSMMLNNEYICSARGDHSGAREDHGEYVDHDTSQAMCSAIVNVKEGDKVKLLFHIGSDATPLVGNNFFYSGFNGFRI